ncbi:P-loop containing nucleoside triphosphate hydrolase protein [Tilletiaria anomala UBC 951]|uniref:p-loop containing nucleoside triphosphate hydrolase protein n=1 Tax=Tilletiaria anomala (strain ATCC 24038 / CBS 436.72 / UBC 951) TaxID=1037660 RepID=A0A066WRL9_TILAU|nr:P-loop containing nucleoside triphosphate hydrolase protein [Tilletiaria anomala UBC 951]KDN53305.1 P-loop containing nucleoside triphosphate hydrolase protein [Tilletiaria anomala UBC 951]
MAQGKRYADASASDDEYDRADSPIVHEPQNGPPKTKRARLQSNDASDDEDSNQSSSLARQTEHYADQMATQLAEEYRSRPVSRHEKADYGVIEKVELFNFMCHKRLSVQLGPNTNFIVGNNGSGKSAVLTAITAALGGKASCTNRGNSLKSFVKSGESAAEVILQIKNTGSEAFKHDVYGDRITIVRRINADGGGSWKLKGQDDRVKTTKREELDAMCDHMDIQVDNPMSVLSQDSARQFLSASNPDDKYLFFLKGTQLSQLAKEMDVMKSHEIQMKGLARKHKETLPELKQDLEEKRRRFALFEKQRLSKSRLEHLGTQYIWSQVAVQRNTRDRAQEDVAVQEGKIKKANAALEAAEAALEHANATISLLEEEKDKDQGVDDDLQTNEAAVQQELAAALAAEHQAKNRLHVINDEYASFKAKQTSIQKQLDDELKKIARQGEAETWNVRRMELQEKAKSLRENSDQLLAKQDVLESELPGLTHASANADEDLARGQARLRDLDARITSITNASREHLTAYGRNMPDIVRAINQDKQWRQKPIGPIGTLLSLKDQAWLPVIEAVLDKALNAFIVTNEEDRVRLNSLLRKYRGDGIPILKASDEPFDYSSGEPGSENLTILRTLEFQSDFVKRQLIIRHHIEKGVLVKQRRDGDALLRRHLPNVKVCFSQDMFKVTGGYRGSSTETLYSPHGPTRLSKDHQAQLAHYREERVAIEQNKGLLTEAAEKAKAELREKKQELNRTMETSKALKAALRKADDEIQQLTLRLQDNESSSVAHLQEMLDDVKVQMDQVAGQFGGAQTELSAAQEKVQEIEARHAEARKQLEERQSGQTKIMNFIEKEALRRVKHQQDRAHYVKQIGLYEAELVQKREVLKNEEEDLAELTRQAQEETGIQHMDLPRSMTPQKLEKEIAAIEKQMETVAQNTGGMGVEDAKMRLDAAQAAMRDVETKIETLERFQKSLKNSIHQRMQRWHEWRSLISIRAKALFTSHLEHRGFAGTLQFEHPGEKEDGSRTPGRLQIRVRTDASTNDGSGSKLRKEKDPRALSGGEKSFSTICLLLSLWEAINCPIRCLDEFDVFMDAGNRSIATKMILDAGQHNSRIQFILISPQGMANAKLGPETRVIVMKDPERGQGTLD